MKKRTFLSLAAALLVSVHAGAFGLETVENSTEPVSQAKAASITEETEIQPVDEKYGDLIWYSSFDSSDDYTVPDYVKEGSGAKIVPVGLASAAVADDPSGSENKCLELVAKANFSVAKIEAPAYTQPGTYTLVVDLYFPTGTPNPKILSRVEFKGIKDPWNKGKEDDWEDGWDGFVQETGKWITCSRTVKVGDDNQGLVEIGVRRMANIATPYYYDNLRVYCNPSVDADQIGLLDGTKRTFLTLTEDTYTFPEPDDKTDFLAWYNEETGAKYASGAVANKADVLGKTFVSFHQSAEVPAMGFAYEGDNVTYTGDSGKGISFVTDDNRTVMRLWQMPGSMWNGSAYQNDMRVFFIPKYLPSVTAFDPSQYNVVSYCYKIDKAINSENKVSPEKITESDLVRNATPWFAINYSPSNDYGGFYMPGGEHKIGGGNHTTTTGEYHVFTADMSLDSNSISGCKWNDYDTMYGFVIQPNASNYEAITYVDYIRVYRDGITTVTYDTNAPADYEEVIRHEVAAETGRGLGKGYLLTGDKPVIEDLTFVGWATKKDATAADVITSINLTGDVTLYAVWMEDGEVSPTLIQKNQLRTNEPSGIRFAATMNLSVKNGVSGTFKGVTPDKYGFIVSRKALLDGNELVIGTTPDEKGTGKMPNGAIYVSGVAYDREKGIDRIYDNDGSTFEEVTAGRNEAFTAILWNIPESGYAEVLVARPYIQIGGMYFYGDAREVSMKSVATEMKEKYDTLTEEEKALVDKILSVTGA